MSLIHQALHAFKWSVLGEVASRAIGPLVFLVLARLLVPEDFGVVAAATVIISFSQVFSDAGLAKALIQRHDRVEESANVAFWLNLGIGLVIAAILLVGAPFIASFFHDDRIAPVVRVLSLQILLAAFSSVHTALLQKDLDFKQLFWVRLITTGVPGLASIPLAINGMGYWALVAGTLVGQVVQSAALWMRSPWRPSWGLDRALAGELVAFGKWAMLSGLLGWFYGWMDVIIVGHYLGSRDMGLYQTGNALVTMVFGIFFSPLLPVLYSTFARMQKDLASVRKKLLLVSHAASLVALPIGFLLFVTKDLVSTTIFGPSWDGVAFVIGVRGLSHAVAWLVGFNGEAYRAIGKPNAETFATLISVVSFLTAYLIGVRYGLETFLIVKVIMAVLTVPLHIFVSTVVLNIPANLWMYSLNGVLVIFVGVLAFVIAGGNEHIYSLSLVSLATLMVYIYMERTLLRRLLQCTPQIFHGVR